MARNYLLARGCTPVACAFYLSKVHFCCPCLSLLWTVFSLSRLRIFFKTFCPKICCVYYNRPPTTPVFGQIIAVVQFTTALQYSNPQLLQLHLLFSTLILPIFNRLSSFSSLATAQLLLIFKQPLKPHQMTGLHL